jgi:pilus assembly protein Flp/PilA
MTLVPIPNFRRNQSRQRQKLHNRSLSVGAKGGVMEKIKKMYKKPWSQFHSKLREEKGATMVEYALMVALIAVVCITAVSNIGTNANNTFTDIAAKVGKAAPAVP